jgi:spore coat polysaccharide biosynthesis protein SpsF
MDKKSIQAIMQTRTGSTRLPGKALKTICGKTVTELIIERLKTISVGGIIAAIPEKEDPSFSSMLEKAGAAVFRGSEEDVLSRFHGAASQFLVKVIVRINGDNLLIHPQFVTEAINILVKTHADYVNVAGAPVGTGVDVFTFEALDRAFRLPNLTPSEKEHVIPVFFREGLFKRESFNVKGPLARESLRLTLDTQQDFDMLTKIYEKLYHPPAIVSLVDAVYFLDAHPDIVSMNKDVKQKGWK